MSEANSDTSSANWSAVVVCVRVDENTVCPLKSADRLPRLPARQHHPNHTPDECLQLGSGPPPSRWCRFRRRFPSPPIQDISGGLVDFSPPSVVHSQNCWYRGKGVFSS